MVQPQMEYASVIWDPYYNSDRDILESIQRRAARWVLELVHAVSLMLHQLSWPTLQIRWNISRLQLFHKIFHYQISLSIPTYYLPVTRDTQHYITLIISFSHLYQPHHIYSYFFKNNQRMEQLTHIYYRHN